MNCPAINNLAKAHPALKTGGSRTNNSWILSSCFGLLSDIWCAWSTSKRILESFAKFVDWKSSIKVPIYDLGINFFYPYSCFVWLQLNGNLSVAKYYSVEHETPHRSNFSLPFSDTPFFNFNPDLVLAVLIATICFPFLIALMLFSTIRLFEVHNEGLNRMPGSASPWKERRVTGFGILSLTGAAFIVINIATSIIPNEHLVRRLRFYVLFLVPIIAADILLTMVSSNKSNHDRYTNRVCWIKYLAGGYLV